MPTAGAALLDALAEAGVRYIFANFGSDHPAIMEAMAEARAKGLPLPEVITAPVEMVGLAAAQGFAQASGEAQAVIVHVDAGTQSLGGAVHNAARGRAPVFIFAGLTPATQAPEVKGSRGEFIQWLQDVRDQRGLVREYVRYENEIRHPANVRQIVWRALQFARSDPQGPVYVTAAREVLEQAAPKREAPAGYAPLRPTGLAPEDAEAIVGDLTRARAPLVVTSYLGRSAEAVEELVKLCRRLGVGVVEAGPSAMNFPADDPLHQGTTWNHREQHPALAEADVVLILDSDVPWIPKVNRPPRRAVIHHIDVDPLKTFAPLWHVPAARSYQASSLVALRQLNALLDRRRPAPARVAARLARHTARHTARQAALAKAEAKPAGAITPAFLVATVRKHIGEDAICLSESVTNFPVVSDHLRRTRPGTFLNSGGASLGWNGGAALGVKLARPDALVVAISGDGSYIFSQPSAVFWMSRRYKAPFLQVVLNNGGWRAPRFSTLSVHPDGYASRANDLSIGFDPAPDYGAIAAAAGGAWARTVKDPDELDAAVAEAVRVVRDDRRAAVLDVWLP